MIKNGIETILIDDDLTFMANKSLAEIIGIFYKAYNNAVYSLIELRDIADNKHIYERDGENTEEAERVMNHFYENAEEAMKLTFHRIVGLSMYKENEWEESERIHTFPTDFPFDSVHELCGEGIIWFERGEYAWDDDEMDINNMKMIVDYFNEL